MTFDQILASLKTGTAYTRSAWTNGAYIAIANGVICWYADGFADPHNWIARSADLLAEDWYAKSN